MEMVNHTMDPHFHQGIPIFLWLWSAIQRVPILLGKWEAWCHVKIASPPSDQFLQGSRKVTGERRICHHYIIINFVLNRLEHPLSYLNLVSFPDHPYDKRSRTLIVRRVWEWDKLKLLSVVRAWSTSRRTQPHHQPIAVWFLYPGEQD